MHQLAVLTQSEEIIWCQPDFQETTEATKDHYLSFTQDWRPSSALVANRSFFAQTLDEMLQIVSKVTQTVWIFFVTTM